MTPSPHTEHRSLNPRGYLVSGCMECELRYRMAFRDYAPDSATENMAAVAMAVAVLLTIFLLSSWVPLQPPSGPVGSAGVVVEVRR